MPLEEAGTSVSAPRSLEEGLERLMTSVTHAASTSHDARRERSSDADADRTSGDRGGASEDASAPSASRAATFDGQLVAVESRGPSHVASTVPSTHAVRAERLAEAVAARVPEAPTRFSITVTPESLGAVEVQLVVRGQAVHLSMQAASDEARDTLAAGMDELRAALLSRGLSLSGADVGTQGEGAQHAPRSPRWEDEDGAPRDSRGIATVAQSESTRPTRPTPRRTADGRVDLHA